jgi:lipoprotein-releasing system permease protein
VLLPVVGILTAGLLALAVSLALFFGYRFERFVGLRYLLRARRSSAARAGLVLTAVVTALGLVALFAARGHSREIETVGVMMTLLGGMGLLLFALLRVFSVFTTVSTMGLVLGVASLVVVLAVTTGFEREFEEKVLAVNAHLLVMTYGEPGLEERERVADEYMKKLKGLPGLKQMAKFSLSAGEVMIGKVGANLKGVDVKAGSADLKRARIAGDVDDLARPARCSMGPAWARDTAGEGDKSAQEVGRIFLGAELAHTVRAKVGDCISVLVPFGGENPESEPVAFPFKVVGLFRLGFHEYDTRLAYTSLEDARRIAGARLTLFGVELRFHDPHRALEVEPEVIARLGYEPRLMDWETLNHNLFRALLMQKLIIALFLMIIIIVAAFNIIASLTMIVLSKVREIAILAAMGARKGGLLRLFLVAGSLVGFVGVGLGLVYGLAVCGLASLYGYPLDPKVYLIARLPVDISLGEVIFVAASTQLICVLATLYPALRASRLKVVDGLRYT